jgi:hypothetical protein
MAKLADDCGEECTSPTDEKTYRERANLSPERLLHICDGLIRSRKHGSCIR